jgi:hypothetical protein
MAQRPGSSTAKLRAIISESRADNSRNAARDHLGMPRAIKSERCARSPRNPHDLTYEQIAWRLDLDTKAVERHVARALVTLTWGPRRRWWNLWRGDGDDPS